MERRQLYRDGLLATATCTVLLLGSRYLGVDTGVFAEPLPISVGCVGMVGLELLLLRNSDLTRRLWQRRLVRTGSVLGVLVGSGLAVSVGAVWVVAVLFWGLVAYVTLVGVVLVSEQNPLTRG
jgi:hypothetical protein